LRMNCDLLGQTTLQRTAPAVGGGIIDGDMGSEVNILQLDVQVNYRFC
jgi:hypothetical protein